MYVFIGYKVLYCLYNACYKIVLIYFNDRGIYFNNRGIYFNDRGIYNAWE
jgi:hypothetical protein